MNYVRTFILTLVKTFPYQYNLHKETQMSVETNCAITINAAYVRTPINSIFLDKKTEQNRDN